ncbi:RfaG Glycosyltransferase [Flavobacteriaceae bacterium]
MKVLLDTTWIGSHYKQNSMHGGLRVIYELTKQLENSVEIELYYSSNKYQREIIDNLIMYLKENKIENISKKLVNNQSDLFRILHSLNLKIKGKLNNNLNILKPLISNPYNSKILEMIDIYHSPMEAIPEVIKKYGNIKRVFTSHDLMPFTRPDLAPIRFKDVLKPAYDSIDSQTKVICVSEFTKSELLEYRKDLNENQIDVIYLGIDRNIFFPNNNKEGLSLIFEKYDLGFEKYFLCLNRNQKYKNTEHIINSYIKLVNQEELNDIGLILIGTFDSLEIKKMLYEKCKNYKNIIFIEFVPDNELSLFYSNALCFLYMSLYEGFGLPVIEAMQCGTPVICSNQASLPEVIGDYGICIDPFDPDLLCSHMLNLLQNSNLQKELIIKSIKRSSFFSWEKNLSETISVYKKALNE